MLSVGLLGAVQAELRVFPSGLEDSNVAVRWHSISSDAFFLRVFEVWILLLALPDCKALTAAWLGLSWQVTPVQQHVALLVAASVPAG